MSNYNTFLGIDIGKSDFVAALGGDKKTKSFANTPAGIKSFLKTYAPHLPQALVVLETTGGFEHPVIKALLEKNVPVHRANTRQVKSFIRSWGKLGKSDALDAAALASYGQERHESLVLFQPPSPQALKLEALTARRHDLVHMCVQEKNRLQSPHQEDRIFESCQKIISFLTQEIETIEQEIQALIASTPDFQKKQDILQTVPGIGKIISSALLAYLPELGQLDRRQIASICGLAPHPCESGKKIGYRRTKGGRRHIRALLFIAAMAARNSHSPLRAFYENLITRGKKKMVALIALARKIIVIANARLREATLVHP